MYDDAFSAFFIFFYKLRAPPWVVALQSRSSITAILWKFAYYTLYYPLDYNATDI